MKTAIARRFSANAPLLIAIGSAAVTSALILSNGPARALTEAAIASMLLAILVLAAVAATAPFLWLRPAASASSARIRADRPASSPRLAAASTRLRSVPAQRAG